MGKDTEFSISVILKAIDNITNPLKTMNSRIKTFTRQVASHFTHLTSALRTVDRWIGRAVTVAGVAAFYLLQRSIRAAVSTALEFDEWMMRMVSKMPGQVKRGTTAFKELRSELIGLGKESEFGPAEIANAADTLKLAGLARKAIVEVMPSVTKLATIAKVSPAEAAGMAMDILGALGLRTKNAIQLNKNLTDTMDKMAVAIANSNMGLTDLYETIKTGGPAVMTLGGDIDTFFAFSMALANAAQKSEFSGTMLKNIWVRLATVTKSQARMLGKSQIKLFTENTKGQLVLKPGAEFIKAFEKGFKSMEPRLKNFLKRKFLGMRGIVGFSSLLLAGSDRLSEYVSMVKNATGSATEMANVIRQSLSLRLQHLGAGVDRIKLKLLDLTEGAFLRLLDRFDSWVDVTSEMIDNNPKLINEVFGTIIGVVKDLGGDLKTLVIIWGSVKLAGLALSGITVVVETLTGVMWLLNLSIVAIPLLLIGMLFLATAVVYSLMGDIKTFEDAVLNFVDWVGGLFDTMLSGISSQFPGLRKLIGLYDTATDKYKKLTGAVAADTHIPGGAMPFGPLTSEVPTADSVSLPGSFIGDFVRWLGESNKQIAMERSGLSIQSSHSPSGGQQGEVKITIEDKSGSARVDSFYQPDWLQVNELQPSGGFL